ncbi:Bax inhibitor-1/YccA family protein [Celeribacter sp. ULVN23_4]
MADYRTIHAGVGARSAEIDAGLRAHMNKVYGTMSVGLLVTALAAWALSNLAVTSTPTEYQVGIGEYLSSFGYALYVSPLKWVIMFAPLAMVFGFGAVIGRLSAAAAQTYFYAYAALMGLSLSSIFLVFTGVSITQTFFVTAGAFAGLSLWGYTTKKDISGWGSFLIMGVIGILIASVVNIFLKSTGLEFAISAIGVLLFAGLTAYDTQRIKTDYIAHAHAMDGEWLAKSAIMGALNLYLDFINLFMFLLQFLGNRD